MKSKPYKIIFILLAFSLIGILVLQSVWISKFYNQKLEAFRSSVLQTMSHIADKLNERENINFIKQSVTPKTSTKITKSGHSVKVVVSAAGSTNDIGPMSDEEILKHLKMDTLFDEEKIIISDSLVQIHNNHKAVIINKQIKDSKPNKKDINQLLDKMLMEINTIDVSPIEDLSEDSLKSIITRELKAFGILIPFEFCLKKESKDTEKILAKSKNFNENDPNVFAVDLSQNKIFNNHNYLYLKFPDLSKEVFSQMKNMLILSMLFSLIMIAVFYFTIKTILNQKKIGDMKNDFINNMTHELKTPIATISLAIDAISNPAVKNDDERFHKYTAILKEENQKLNTHVERVLQMASLDKGELQLNKTQIDINRLIREIIQSHKLQINKQQAQVLFNDEGECFIYADEFHLQAVLNNLLDNALKYSKENARIDIQTQKTDNQLIVSIKDNGIGIDKVLQTKIFDKFFRVQGGNLHDIKGFGLGLSYVKSIIEKHNGTIEVQSELGVGAEFRIILPIHEK